MRKWLKWISIIILGVIAIFTLSLFVIGIVPVIISGIKSLVSYILGHGLSATIALAIVYFVLRIVTMTLSPKDILFTSPKLGRIKAVMKNGKIVAFFAHLKGLTGELSSTNPDIPYVGPVHIDEATGKILAGKEQIWSFWWILFGVRWIGFNKVFNFEITKRTIGADGKIVETVVTARSLHFTNIYPMIVKGKETIEGERGDLTFTITLQTTHAGESLKYGGSFIEVALPPAEGVAKDYVSDRTVKQMITDKSELSQSANSFVSCMRVLNDDRVGNTSLEERVGQRLTAASLMEVQFVNAVAESLEAKEIAKNEGEAAVETARLAADAKEQEARGERAKRQVEVDMLEKIVELLGKPGGREAAQMEIARHMKGGIAEYQGSSLGLGGQLISNLPLDGTKKEEPK